MILIADTSGLIVASDSKAPESDASRRALETAGTVIVSPLVLTEVDHLALARFGSRERTDLIRFVMSMVHRGRFLLSDVTTEIMDTALSVQDQYRALDLDLADAVNVALAAEFLTEHILTLDRRDFRAIKPLTPHPAFKLLPDDLAL